jgi:hypothetical protein
VQQPGNRAGARLGDHVGDRPQKRHREAEVKVDRSRNCSGLLRHDMERAAEHLAPMKEDLPWNRCC